MKIVVISDLHGWLPKITEPFDLLLICGDICPAHDHYYSFQNAWFEEVFRFWIKNLPYKDIYSKVIMTWGNHDFCGERYNETFNKYFYAITDNRLIILKNKATEFEWMGEDGIKTLKIFGTPYCKIFGNWAFMIDNKKLEEKFSKCPQDVDLIISHDAPHMNNLGLIQNGFQSGIDAGNPELDKLIERVKPKYYFCGHIHSGNHTFEKVGDTMLANASLVTEQYYPSHSVLEFDMDDNKEIVEGSIRHFDVECEEN